MEDKNLALIAMAVLLLVGLIAIGGNYIVYGELSLVSECSGGSSVLSIDDAYITTSSDLGGKKVVRVTAVANGGGECLTINWDDSLIEDKLDGEYVVDNSVFGQLTTKSQTQEFTFSSFSPQKSVYKVFVDEISAWCSEDACEDEYGVGNVLSAYIPGLNPWKCGCVYQSLEGRAGRISSGSSKDFEVEFSIDDLGDTTLTIDDQSGEIGDDAFIKWQGDLMSGYWLSSPSGNYDGYLSVSEQDWIMVNKEFYEDLEDELDYISDSDGCLMIGDSDDREQCAAVYNSFFDLLTNDAGDDWADDEYPIVDNVYTDGNDLIAELNTYTTWQVFTIDLDAEFVGIHINEGDPEVKCPSGGDEITSGELFTDTFEVKDLSGTNPTFGLSLDCSSSGEGDLEQTRISNVGTSYEEIEGYISGTFTSEKDFTCTFKAYDLNTPSNYDTCTVSYTGIPFTGCTPGEKTCSSDASKLGTCKSDGTSYTWEGCDYGCEAIENTYRCRLQTDEICNDGIDNDGDGLVDDADPDCDSSWFGSVWDWLKDFFGGVFGFAKTIKYLIVVVVPLFILFFLENVLKGVRGLSENAIARWAISIIVAVGLAVFLVQFIGSLVFWILVILGIGGVLVLGYVRSMIPTPK